MTRKPRRKRKAAVECPNCLVREIVAVVVTLAAVGAFYMAAINGILGVSD